MSQITQMYH